MGVELASRLLDAACRHGLPRQRWAVADWDRDFFEGDQKAVRNARFSTDIAGREKANASDHLLREKIHFVLREHPEIPVYVIGTGDGDFHEVVKTLQAQGKQVILWATRRAVSESLRRQPPGARPHPDRVAGGPGVRRSGRRLRRAERPAREAARQTEARNRRRIASSSSPARCRSSMTASWRSCTSASSRWSRSRSRARVS